MANELTQTKKTMPRAKNNMNTEALLPESKPKKRQRFTATQKKHALGEGHLKSVEDQSFHAVADGLSRDATQRTGAVGGQLESENHLPSVAGHNRADAPMVSAGGPELPENHHNHAGQNTNGAQRHFAGQRNLDVRAATAGQGTDEVHPEFAGSGDHKSSDTHATDVSGGQRLGDAQHKPASEAADHLEQGAHPIPVGDQQGHDAQTIPVADLVMQIREQYRLRTAFHRAEKSLTLQIKAQCRRLARGQVCKGEKCERVLCKPDEAQADKLYQAILGKDEHPQGEMLKLAVSSMLIARDAIAKSRKSHEKIVADLAEQLPVYPWVKAIRGFGALGLGIIVGEAGDLGNYANPGKLWKRMGLAVDSEGQRQRRVKGVDGIEQGYSPSRRSAMWTIGGSLFKTQSERTTTLEDETVEVTQMAGEYRLIYDQRKSYEITRIVNGVPITPGHAHNRSTRYVEKRLLRNLWQAWRGSSEGQVLVDAH